MTTGPQGERCVDCYYFDKIIGGYAQGLCVNNRPERAEYRQAYHSPEKNEMWPVVAEEWWCGKYVKREGQHT